jgi:hypothetical protein
MNPARVITPLRKDRRVIKEEFFSSEFLRFVTARRSPAAPRHPGAVGSCEFYTPLRGGRVAPQGTDVLGRPRMASGHLVAVPVLLDALNDGPRNSPGAIPRDGAFRVADPSLLARLAELLGRVLR